MASMKAAGVVFLFSLLLAGCADATRPRVTNPAPDPLPAPPHVAGEVIVGFHDDVTESQADSMFASHRLKWRSQFARDFAYWVEVEAGDPAAAVVLLKQFSIVRWAERRGNPLGNGSSSYILVFFKVTATQESARTLIDSLPGLRVSSILIPPRWGVAAVEVGREQEWIAILEREPIVKYASLNLIYTIS